MSGGRRAKPLPAWTVRLLHDCRAALDREAENYRGDDVGSRPRYQPHARELHRLADRISRHLARRGG